MIRSKTFTNKAYYEIIKPDCTKEEFLGLYEYISEGLFLLLQQGRAIYPNKRVGLFMITKNNRPPSYNRTAIDYVKTKETGRRTFLENNTDGYRIHLKNTNTNVNYYWTFKSCYKKIISDLAKEGYHKNYKDITGRKGQLKEETKILGSPDRHCKQIFSSAAQSIGKTYSFVYGLNMAIIDVIKEIMHNKLYTTIDYFCFRLKPTKKLRYEYCDNLYVKDIVLDNYNCMCLCDIRGTKKKFRHVSQALQMFLFEPKKFVRLPDYEEKTVGNYLLWQYGDNDKQQEIESIVGKDLSDLRTNIKKWASLTSTVLKYRHNENVPVDYVESILTNLVSK